MKRNRIIIYLDSLRGGAKQPRAGVNVAPQVHVATRSGVARPLVIIGIILFLLLGGVIGGAYYWWRQYQDSPAYSLATLADAAQRNDTATIDTILDTDKVTEDFVAQVRKRLSESPSLTALWQSPANPTASTLTPKLRQTVHDEFVKELRRLSEPAAGKPFILVALAIRYFANIKQEDKVAHAAVNIKDEHLELTMQWDGGRWRIVAVKDEKLTKQVADSVMSSMPARGAQIEEEIRKQLEKLKLP